MKKTIALVICIAFIFSSCAYRVGDFTIASTKNISMPKIDLSKSTSTGVFEGKDTKHIIIFIPLGVPNIEEALDRALEKGDGNYMTDAVLYYKWWYIPYIYGRISFVVKGQVHKFPEQ